jgi:hypothetical protein
MSQIRDKRLPGRPVVIDKKNYRTTINQDHIYFCVWNAARFNHSFTVCPTGNFRSNELPFFHGGADHSTLHKNENLH